jgi:hypothetical protein
MVRLQPTSESSISGRHRQDRRWRRVGLEPVGRREDLLSGGGSGGGRALHPRSPLRGREGKPGISHQAAEIALELLERAVEMKIPFSGQWLETYSTESIASSRKGLRIDRSPTCWR